MTSFERLLADTLAFGEQRTDRTGTGTLSLFAPEPLRFPLAEGRVPLITSKDVPWKMALREFMWVLSGSTSTKDLAKTSPAMANIWNNWANEDGDIGPTYGAQYRNAGGTLAMPVEEYAGLGVSAGIDQLTEVVDRLVSQPDTRRAVISLWSAPELHEMALEPCMVLFQFSLRGPQYDRLQLHVYQRSADLMLGVPFDLFQAGALAHMVAREVSLISRRTVTADRLIWSAGDVHIYTNQVAPVRLQLAQAIEAPPMRARISIDPFPSLRLLDGTLEAGHISVSNYHPMGAISAPIAV